MVAYARLVGITFVRTDCFGTSWAPSPTIFGCFIGLQNWGLTVPFVNGQSRRLSLRFLMYVRREKMGLSVPFITCTVRVSERSARLVGITFVRTERKKRRGRRFRCGSCARVFL